MSQGRYPQGNFPPNQGFPQNQGGYQRKPNIQSPLVWSILSTIFCCVPFGIVSIVYAAKVNSLVASGAFQDAQDAAGKAKMWAWIAFGIGLVVNILVVFLQILAAAAEEGAI